MMEYGVRLAGRRNKVTARFSDLADLAREACYAAARSRGESWCAPRMCARLACENRAPQPDRNARFAK